MDIQGLTAATMEILLDFVYTETVLVTVENVQELLPAACLLQLKGKHSQNGFLRSCDRTLPTTHTFGYAAGAYTCRYKTTQLLKPRYAEPIVAFPA